MATLEELENGLRKAHAAGNADHARAFAAEIRKMREQPAPMAEPMAPEPAANPAEGMSGFDQFAAGMGKSLVDAYRGAKQAGTELIRHAAQNPQGTADNAVTQWADESLGRQQAEIDDARRLDAPLMDTPEGVAGNIVGYGAQLLTPAAGVRGTMAARALLPSTVAGNAAQGAALGAIQPVGSEGSRVANAGFGGAFGAGGAALAKGVGAIADRAKQSVAPHVREVYEAAKARGIDLSPAQISDSRFMKWTQSMLRSVPFTGAQARYGKQVDQFNRQLASTIGEDAPVITSQVYGEAKRRQSDKFTELTARNAMQVSDRLVKSLSNIADSAKVGGEQIANQVESAIDALYAQATTGPKGVVVPGEAYQAFDSQINSILKSGGPAAHFLGNVQTAVRRAMDDSISPEDAMAWRQLRKEYGNRKTLAPLVAKAADGPISPAQVMGAATASKSSKEAMASGSRGELGELANIGQRLKEPPSSGSAERGMVGAILGGGAVVDPITGGMTALGLNMLSRGMDSAALAKIIMRQNPGMTRKAAAEIIRRSANPVGQNRAADRPLEIDIVGGTPVPAEQLRGNLYR